MDLPANFTLNDGVKVPAIGLGTFQGDSGNSKVKDAVKLALKLGYRHIDGANAYGNGEEIGQGIKESGVPREEIFVTSKLAQTWHEPKDVEAALDLSLKDLQLDYVDLYLMHSAMEKLVDSGKARAIGLSNFNILKTKRILEVARIVPAVNQVEIHPFFPQRELFEFSAKHGILLMAHQPLGGRPVGVVRAHPDEPFPTDDPTVVEVARSCNISPAQACLAWALQRGIPVVPKSVQEAHMKENLQLKKLPDGSFEAMESISTRRGFIRFLDPTPHLGFNIFDEENDQPVANSAPWN